MITTRPVKFQRHNRPARQSRVVLPPAGPLALIAASLVTIEGERMLRLTFNQAIDIADLAPNAINVIDGTVAYVLYTGGDV